MNDLSCFRDFSFVKLKPNFNLIFRLDINANIPPLTDDSQVAQIDQHSQRQELQSTPRQTLSDGARSNSSKDSDKLQRKNQLLLQLREFRMAQQKQQIDAALSGGTNGTDETEIELSLDQNIHSTSFSHSSSSNQEWEELTRSTGSNVSKAKHGKTSHSPEPDPNENSPTNAVTFKILKLIKKKTNLSILKRS